MTPKKPTTSMTPAEVHAKIALIAKASKAKAEAEKAKAAAITAAAPNAAARDVLARLRATDPHAPGTRALAAELRNIMTSGAMFSSAADTAHRARAMMLLELRPAVGCTAEVLAKWVEEANELCAEVAAWNKRQHLRRTWALGKPDWEWTGISGPAFLAGSPSYWPGDLVERVGTIDRNNTLVLHPSGMQLGAMLWIDPIAPQRTQRAIRLLKEGQLLFARIGFDRIGDAPTVTLSDDGTWG